MIGNAFDHDRDAELGARLREHLEAPGHAAFVARVRAGMARETALNPFEVLGSWLRPGLAAAAIVAVAAGWWLTTGVTHEVATSTTPVEVFAASGGSELMLATSVEER
jgi:hypothetical protein